MTEEEVIEELLVEWELARNAGRSISAAELCHEHPNLVPHVAHQISLLEQTSWIVDPALLGSDAIDSAGSAIGVTGDDTEIPDSDVTVAEFIDAISSRGLFSPQQQEQLDALLPQDTTARAIQLAHTLIDRGLITEYQARVILQRGDSPLLLDRYVILDSLGGGGMGIVFKALQRSLERIVAVKVLPRHAVDSAEKVERFQREMRAAAKLSHPHVVQAYDAHESNGVYFYAMEYVPGHDLDRLIREQGPMGASEASDTIRQVAEGLAHAHQNGIVHRDVKPSNVLLSDDGTAKILDLGLARTREQSQNARDVSLTAEGLGMGTVAFMAPEQAFDARHADERSDIYSLGCTLYFLLHGRPVFLSEQPVQAVVGHRELPPPELARDREDVSPKLEALFQRMLAKSPDDRPQTMEEVVDELTSEGSRGERDRDALAKQTSGRRQQPAKAARATQESRNRGEQVKGQAEKRRRVIPAVSAALSVLALAAFAVFWSQRSTPEHIARELLQYEDTSLVLELADQSQVAAFYEEDLPTEPFEIFGLVLTPTLDVPLERIRSVPAIRSLTIVSSAGDEPLLADWKQIAALPSLEMLELDGYRLDDRVMRWVRQHRGLYSLDLTACQIPKSRLQTLSALSELRELVLMQTDTSDEDVLACNDLPQLNYLDLSNTLVTQRGLSKLKLPELSTLGVTGNEKLGNCDFLNAFPKLAALYVDGTQFDDGGISRLADLEQLETLHIGHTELTPEGVRQILAMPNLRDLAMDGLPIQQALERTDKLPAWEVLSVQSSDLDDEGLARLSQIRSLQYLVVAETKVTQKAIEKLRLKLPGCEVVTDTEDSMLIDF